MEYWPEIPINKCEYVNVIPLMVDIYLVSTEFPEDRIILIPDMFG